MTFNIYLHLASTVFSKDLEEYFSLFPYEFYRTHSWEEMTAKIQQKSPQLLCFAVEGRERNFAEAVKSILRMSEKIPIIVMHENPGFEFTRDLLLTGMKDIIRFPDEVTRLDTTILECFNNWQIECKRSRFFEDRKAEHSLDRIIGKSDALREVFDLIEKISRSRATTILIQGETGTGKELVARGIHYLSAGAEEPFIAINCTAIPENLLEGELFGYEKGAFTDAVRRKKGLLEAAQGGSVFLDEIGHMSPKLQAKLLKAIEEKEIRRLGGLETIKIDARIISATNINIEKEMAQGNFREDLYYRLNVVNIYLPPLRMRGGDVFLLAQHFIDHYSKLHSKRIVGITPQARRLLMQYDWPGNIRELKNAIERGVLLEQGNRITEKYLPGSDQTSLMRERTQKITITQTLDDFSFETVEGEITQQVLEKTRWNKSEAAKILNISRPRLMRIMERCDIRQDKGK